ncbi:MAG: hypothetical protein OXH76_10935 [Boseongicola sp.]|nr:hypothetical protein [Boseongicola sp.]
MPRSAGWSDGWKLERTVGNRTPVPCLDGARLATGLDPQRDVAAFRAGQVRVVPAPSVAIRAVRRGDGLPPARRRGEDRAATGTARLAGQGDSGQWCDLTVVSGSAGRRKGAGMKDHAPGADACIEDDGSDTVRVELPREACEAISEMCAYLADTIAAGGCGCEDCAERLAQAEAWEGAFRGMAEAGPGMTHEVVLGQDGYVH